MPLLDHFKILAPIYERAIGPADPEEVARRFQVPVDGKVLDAGGGTGRIAKAIVGSAPQIVVADETFAMLQQATTKSGIQPTCARAEALPFPDDIFKRVIMVDAFHHVGDQEKVIAELWRVLQPGGKIVIEEPDIATLPIKVIALLEKLALMRSHFRSPNKIAELFKTRYTDKVSIVKEGTTAWVVADKGG